MFVRDTENVFFFDFHGNDFTDTKSYTETLTSVGELTTKLKQKRPTKIEDWMLQCNYVESVIQGYKLPNQLKKLSESKPLMLKQPGKAYQSVSSYYRDVQVFPKLYSKL